MKAARVPPNPVRSVKDFYLSRLSLIHSEPVTAALNVPGGWKPGESPPHIGVFDDSGPTAWPVAVKPLLRITVWSNGETLSRAIAGRCMGLLLAHSIPGIANVREPSSLLIARDPHNGGVMASFSVRVTSRTLPF